MASSDTHAFTPGVLFPDQLSIVRDVYREIASQDWFPPCDLERLAESVLRRHQAGTIDRDTLLAVCRARASARVATPTVDNRS